MENFKTQLDDFDPEVRFDLLAARYHPLYQHTSQYIEKKELGFNLSASEILSQYVSLQKLNESDYNIYIRPNNYQTSNLIILDDYYSSLSPKELTAETLISGISDKDFAISFALLTSIDVDKKNKDKKSKKYNYQIGVEFNQIINTRQKSLLLTTLCEQLDCDVNHAKISKYLRATGFLNKKYWYTTNQLDEPELKNTLIEYKKYRVEFKNTPINIFPPHAPIQSSNPTNGLLKKMRSMI